MGEQTLNSWIGSITQKEEKNIFQIWKDIGEKTPFAVRRRGWSQRYYTVVEKIVVKKWPYGDAYGYPTENGRYSDHYNYDNNWKKSGIIPCAGCYQWTRVENAIISSDYSALNKAQFVKQPHERKRSIAPKKPPAYTFDEIHTKYPKAYAKWSKEDDEKLKTLFQSGKMIEELAQIFQRKNGAIESRLVKMGLLVKTENVDGGYDPHA